MSDIFATTSKLAFGEYAKGAIQWVSERFPECDETAKCRQQLQNSEADALNEMLIACVSHLSKPLNPKKVKYAKAVERLTKEQPTVMHALMYHDVEGLQCHLQSTWAQKLDLFAKFDDSRLTEADKKVTWNILEKMAVCAYEAAEIKLPTIPSRQDIQENIKGRKKETSSDDGPPSMQRAFMTHINALCKIWGNQPVLQNDDATIKKWMTRWSQFAASNSKKIVEKNTSVIDDLRAAFPELKIPTDVPIEDGVWVNIAQLNSFSTVVDSIPTNMMGRIEDVASKLADDILAGRTDMASVNLNDIGQQVLAQCNEGDMDKFAGNISNILPALQTFQGSTMPN